MEHPRADSYAPDFEAIANQMLVDGTHESPAYLHGGICGVYASAGAVPAEECLAASARALELALQGELAESSLLLAEHTRSALEDESFTFELLLPDDDVEIEYRVRAVSDWCRGFLAAYALLVQRADDAGLDRASGESVADIAAIAEAAVDADADSEESESYLYEITDYLRFAALHLFLGSRDSASADGSAVRGGEH